MKAHISFVRPLIHPPRISVSSPQCPDTENSSHFAPDAHTRPRAPDTLRFFVPPTHGDSLFCPPWYQPPAHVPLSRCCVALRAPRPLFARPAPHGSTFSSWWPFKSRRPRCRCPRLVERFDNFPLTMKTSRAAHTNLPSSACGRHGASAIFFQSQFSKTKIGLLE